MSYIDALDDARERSYDRIREYKPIDYDAANRAFRRHKTALTRAKNSGDPEKVKKTVVETVREWNKADYPWPDNWSMWQIALDDVMPWNERILLEDIR
jgi:hypothetical protein